LADPSAPRGAASAMHVRTCENHAKRRVWPRCPTTKWRQRLSSHGNTIGDGVLSARALVPVPSRVAAPVLSCPKVSVLPGSAHTCPGTHMHVRVFGQNHPAHPSKKNAAATSTGRTIMKTTDVVGGARAHVTSNLSQRPQTPSLHSSHRLMMAGGQRVGLQKVTHVGRMRSVIRKYQSIWIIKA
jgi:hypothetical protein